MTNKEFYQGVIESGASEELVAFAKAALAKAEGKTAKLSESQLRNEEMKESLVVLAEVGKTYIAAEVGAILGESTQKASALLRQLVEAKCFTESKVKVDGRSVKGYTVVEGATYTRKTNETSEPSESEEG